MGDGGLEAVLLGNRAALLRFIRARGGPSDAEDLFQELWLKLSSAPPAGPIAEPLAYLYKTADNMMHDRRRSAARRQRREGHWIDAEAGVTPGASPQPSAERALVAREELVAVERALAQLGERTDRIFRQVRIDGVNQKAIAAEHGISLSSVEKHLQRAYRAITALRLSTTAATREEDPAIDDAASTDGWRREGEDRHDARR